MKKVITVVLSLILIISILGVFAGGVAFYNEKLGFIDKFNTDDFSLDQNSFIYYTDKNGDEVEYSQIQGNVNRIWANYDDISDYTVKAFVAIEDERFYQHHGFDFKRLVGATFNYIVKGDKSYGGSTITQQWVKNVTGDQKTTPARKIREIIRAIKVEEELSKQEILELYLNTIYLGEGCYGVQAASHEYFNKPVSELNLAESACIAGITQNPAKYDPFINPEQNKNKQETVLKKMLDLGDITQDEYEEAKNFELVFSEGNSDDDNSFDRISSYYEEAVIKEVLDDLQTEKGYNENYAAKLVYSGGLKIYSTLDPDIQNVIDEVYTNEDNFSSSSAYEKQPQSAIVVMDPYNGEIKGLYGGRGEKTANLTLNRATNSLRQPGSSIKPVAVYGPAVEEGVVGPGTYVNDKKITINGWTPQNWDNRFHGSMTIKYALAQSYNIPAVLTLQNLGINKSYEYMTKKLHFTTLVSSRDGQTDKTLPSLALGGLTDGVTVKEMCAAYCTFANDGIYTTPHTYTKVLDHDGNVLLEKKVNTNAAFSKETASIMTSMLRSVVTSGTGTAANLYCGIPAAGKTGTSEHTNDLWFCGYTPYYCGAVWYGFDEPADMSSFTSGAISANLWRKVMDKIHEGLEYENFKTLSNVNYSANIAMNGQSQHYVYDADEDKEEDTNTEPSTEGETDRTEGGAIGNDPAATPETPPAENNNGNNTSGGNETGGNETGGEAVPESPAPSAPEDGSVEAIDVVDEAG